MGSTKDSDDGPASRLLLDIKALTLLYPSDSSLKEVLDRSFVDYSDDDVKRLTDVIRPSRQVNRAGSALVAAGEIVLASFLAILGIASFAPEIAGLSSPRQLFDYVAGGLTSSFGSGPISTVTSVADLAFAILLIGGALYILRRAASELRQAGLVIETSDV